MSITNFRGRPGFALRDLLVLLAVMLTMLGGVSCMAQRVRTPSRRTTTMNHMSQCAHAALIGHDQFKTFPPYFGPYGSKEESFTFHVHLLPYLDQATLYAKPAPTGTVDLYLSDLDLTQTANGANGCNFPVNLRLYYDQGGLGALTSLENKNLIYPKMPGSFPDGVSTTLLFATKYMNCGANGGSRWLDPGNNGLNSLTAATFGASMGLWQAAPSRDKCDPSAGTAQSLVAQGIYVAMCDASVRSISVGLSQATWQAAHTPGGNDALGDDWNQ
jgi:hypothetical protein